MFSSGVVNKYDDDDDDNNDDEINVLDARCLNAV